MAKKQKFLSIAIEMYREFLKRHNMFFTQERSMLLTFIFEQEDHFSADELLFELQKSKKKISRATLYRSLSQLVQADILTESDFGHGHTHYEITLGDRPHVHLIDSEADDVREVYSEALEKALLAVAKREGFKIKRNKLQLFGTFVAK